jgi:hypothetical protein
MIMAFNRRLRVGGLLFPATLNLKILWPVGGIFQVFSIAITSRLRPPLRLLWPDFAAQCLRLLLLALEAAVAGCVWGFIMVQPQCWSVASKVPRMLPFMPFPNIQIWSRRTRSIIAERNLCLLNKYICYGQKLNYYFCTLYGILHRMKIMNVFWKIMH